MLCGKITDNKLETITTADKVSGSAVQIDEQGAIIRNSQNNKLKLSVSSNGGIEINNNELQIKNLSVTSDMLTGSIPNSKLVNTTISGVSLGDTLKKLNVDNTSLKLNTGTTYDGSSDVTISINDSGVTNSMLANKSISGVELGNELNKLKLSNGLEFTDVSHTNYTGASDRTIKISSGGITNDMLQGSIDLTSKVTNVLPLTSGGTGSTTAEGIRNNIQLGVNDTPTFTLSLIHISEPTRPY